MTLAFITNHHNKHNNISFLLLQVFNTLIKVTNTLYQHQRSSKKKLMHESYYSSACMAKNSCLGICSMVTRLCSLKSKGTNVNYYWSTWLSTHYFTHMRESYFRFYSLFFAPKLAQITGFEQLKSSQIHFGE